MVDRTWKDESRSRRRFLGVVAGRLKAVIPAPVRRSFPVWLVTAIVIGGGVAGFLVVSPAPAVRADDGATSGIEDCLSCHSRTLELHDKLGPGNQACWACHDSGDMGKLHLADGSQLSLSDSTRLCAQCHQERYDAWSEGTHGISGTVAAVECTACHDPHQPQIALLDITKPHPPAQPAPSPPAIELQVMLGIVGLLAIGVGVAVTQRGGRR